MVKCLPLVVVKENSPCPGWGERACVAGAGRGGQVPAAGG